MNTRGEIITLLSKTKTPLGPKSIAINLNKSRVNIRKILSNLYKEGKIKKVGYGEYIASVKVKREGVNVKGEGVKVKDLETKRLSNKEYYQNLKVTDLELYEKIRLAKQKYYKKWRKKIQTITIIKIDIKKP